MDNVYLGVGTNQGDREKNLKTALRILQEDDNIYISKVSSVYESEPVGYEKQPDFLNCVICVRTDLSPQNVLLKAKEVEKRMGREKSFRWGPRKIDIDILLYGQELVDKEDLKIPHPEMKKRGFVLIPLHEIEPKLTLPGGEKIEDLMCNLPPKHGIAKRSDIILTVDD